MDENRKRYSVSCMQCGTTVKEWGQTPAQIRVLLEAQGWDIKIPTEIVGENGPTPNGVTHRAYDWCDQCIANAYADSSSAKLAALERSVRQKAAKQTAESRNLYSLLLPHSILQYWNMPGTEFEVLFVHGLPMPKGSRVYLRRSSESRSEIVFSRNHGNVTKARVWEVIANAADMFLTDRWDGDFEVLRSIVLTSLVNVLEEIPRVTADGAKELIQRFGSIGAILRATSGDPQDVESAGGVVDVSCVQEAVEDTAIPDLDRLLEEVDQMRARKRKSA